MNTPVPPPLPQVPTNPKITASSLTPVSPLPPAPREDTKVKSLGWAGFGTAILSVIFWAVKELGGLAALRDLPPIVIFALAVVFVVAAAIVAGKGMLDEMRAERNAIWALANSRDEKQTSILNEQSMILDRQGLLLDRLASAQAETKHEMRRIRKDVGRILEHLGEGESEDETPPQPRRSGAHGIVSESIETDDTPPETPTGRQRRIAGR